MGLRGRSPRAAVRTFALVHGGAHGAWCWERLVPELEARGHRAVAMDLPIEDESAGASRYADIVMDAVAGEPDDLVVVGHSLGGLTIPLVAERRPVGRLVFLCAAMPDPGRSFVDQWQTDPDMLGLGFADFDVEADNEGKLTEMAADLFYNDCPPDVVAGAVPRLRRQAVLPVTEVTPLTSWPDVERTYVLCRDDHAIQAEWSRRTARRRLGVDPVELPGSHSPFLSRPAELADVLARVVS